MVEGSDIRVPQLAAVGFDARSPRWKGWTDGPRRAQPCGRPPGGVQPEWWQGAERRRQGEGCEPASPRVGSARRPMRARRVVRDRARCRNGSPRSLFRGRRGIARFISRQDACVSSRTSFFFSLPFFTSFSRTFVGGIVGLISLSTNGGGHVGYYCFSNS